MESFKNDLQKERDRQHNIAEQNESRKWLRLGTYAAIGSAVLTLLAVNVHNRINESGKGETLHALVQKAVEPNQVLHMCSVNMHNETNKLSMLVEMAEEDGCDPLAAQEFNGEDIETLRDYLPEKNIVSVTADAFVQEPLGGGQTNVLITSHEPRNVQRISIKGIPLDEGLLAAAGEVLPNLTAEEAWAAASNELQEDRAAVAMTIKVDDEGQQEDLVVMTGHIVSARKGGEPNEQQRQLHVYQLSELIEFIENNTEENTPAIFCGDLNASREEIEQAFAGIGYVVAENDDGRTSVNDDVEIDYCAYYGAGVLGRGKVAVLWQYSTDHFAIEFISDGDQSNNPVEYFSHNFPFKK